MRVYLAAPLFSDAERAYNETIAATLREVADVFLPQDSGLLLMDLLSKGVSHEDAYARIFAADWDAVRKADLLIAILDGAVVDEGVAVEIGLAYASNIPCVGLKTDWRTQLQTGDNPMVVGALKQVFTNVAHLVQFIVGLDATDIANTTTT